MALVSNGTVIWAPQAWHADQEFPPIWGPVEKQVGYYDYIAFYSRMDARGDGVIEFKLYVYEDFLDMERDTPVIHSMGSPNFGDNHLLVGESYLGWWPLQTHVMHFQFGAESKYLIQWDWKILEHHASYSITDTWWYKPAKSIHGDKAYITCGATSKARVGGDWYQGVDAVQTSADLVKWQYTEWNTIPNYKVLWSEQGQVSDIVSKPYE
ncbi:MAG: hypothetical protein ACE5Z5_05540 [Candidatus Bathyarchaeia archaeon]